MLAHGAKQSTRTLCAPISYIMEKKKKADGNFSPRFHPYPEIFQGLASASAGAQCPTGSTGGPGRSPMAPGLPPSQAGALCSPLILPSGFAP